MRALLAALLVLAACRQQEPAGLATAVLGSWTSVSAGITYTLTFRTDHTGEVESGSYRYTFHWHIDDRGRMVRHLDDLDSDNISDLAIRGDTMMMHVHDGPDSTWQRGHSP